MAAKAQPTILKQFFEGHRRKAFLVQWIQHCNRAGVSTIKLDMRLPLLNQAVLGMNDEIGEPFGLMAKNDSKARMSRSLTRTPRTTFRSRQRQQRGNQDPKSWPPTTLTTTRTEGKDMSNAVRLYKPDGTSAGVFICSVCRTVHATEDQANWCHGERLCACGKKIQQGYFQRECKECQWKEWREKEAVKESERFEKATKIKASDYAGEHIFCGDQYYDSVEDAVDQFLEGQEPEYVWACQDSHLPKVYLEDVTCNLLDNMWDDADISDLNGIEELEAALKAFNEANESVQIWEVDYSTAILVQH